MNNAQEYIERIQDIVDDMEEDGISPADVIFGMVAEYMEDVFPDVEVKIIEADFGDQLLTVTLSPITERGETVH